MVQAKPCNYALVTIGKVSHTTDRTDAPLESKADIYGRNGNKRQIPLENQGKRGSVHVWNSRTWINSRVSALLSKNPVEVQPAL
ncbi:hypothetical protein [Nostoc sp. CHAB 5715]|uniref:hypothetical protein n=1 Tax=Nostoc sp. CHAB 5715 TaxID=2780400 RepID=UPI001E5FE138|nr:hypothetical protein [Nostoc sp. CHAB 5715]MCC5624050.1 hypothetical protein [Nostoc sp. CHAB 5715]